VTHAWPPSSFAAEVFTSRLFLLDEFILRRQYLTDLRRLRPALFERAKGAPLRIVDAGANVGLFPLFATAVLRMPLRLAGFEPLADNRVLCERNWRDLEHDLRSEALAAEAGPVELHLVSTTGATIIPKEAESWAAVRRRPPPETVAVDRIRLDDADVGRVDLLKLDIEGAEQAALEGARKTIERDRPFVLCSYEHHVSDRSALIHLMHPFGYAVHDDDSSRVLTFEPV
jgi:FkbM family methyltransferase